MKALSHSIVRALLLSAIPLMFTAPLAAQDAAGSGGATSAAVSPEIQAILDRMTASLKALKTYSIDAQITRDEMVRSGYKVQHNQRSVLTVQLPNKLRAEVTGDIKNRTSVYDGAKLTMYSPDKNVYARVDAPDTVGKLVSRLLDLGVDMPLIDVLSQANDDSLTERVQGAVLVGDATIDGVPCDQIAFRQETIDWQLWVEQGAQPLPKKIVITTRYEFGDPQFQATLRWNLKPKIDSSTFVFTAPKDAKEIGYRQPADSQN